MTKPNEPTLTCSEVVERLRCRVIHQGYPKGTTCADKRAKAISHPERYDAAFREELVDKKHYCNECYASDEIEWRERRVQELEEALRGMLRESIVLSKDYLETVSVGLRDSNTVQGWDIARWKRAIAAKELAEKVLAGDEWREQIRKGANHEG